MSDSLKRGSEVIIYYHFLSSRDAMTDLERKMIKVSRIVNLNDLFELRPYLSINRDKRSQLEKLRSQIAKTYGMVCFSSDWQEPLLWGHYADRNRGIALGFEVISKRWAVRTVNYPPKRERDPFGDKKVIGEDEYIFALGYTKYANWAYENEQRFFIKLDDCVNIEGNYFLPFGSDLLLRSVILGPEHPYKNRNNYRRSAAYLAGLVKSFGADILVTRAERKGYRIVRCGRWTPLFEELMKKL
jgi:hypothetical protein